MYSGSSLLDNARIRELARERLEGNWLMAVLVCLVFSVLMSLTGALPALGQVILCGPLVLGLSIYFIKLVRDEGPAIENLFEGFSQFVNSLLLWLLTSIFIFLWTLLLIIPGIIAYLRYSMAYYIMIDNPGINALEAINLSKEMMAGNKGKLFLLYLSFIGWFLLCILTCGIGFLWLYPYVNTAVAIFYEDLKRAMPAGRTQAF